MHANVTLVVCKITKIEHVILSIVHLYFQELKRESKSGKWSVDETIQEDKLELTNHALGISSKIRILFSSTY